MHKGIKLIIVQICLSILSIQIIECCVKPNGYVLFFSLTFDIDSNYREGNQAHIYAANLNIDSRIGSGNGNVDGCCLSCDLDTNTYISTFAFWKGNRTLLPRIFAFDKNGNMLRSLTIGKQLLLSDEGVSIHINDDSVHTVRVDGDLIFVLSLTTLRIYKIKPSQGYSKKIQIVPYNSFTNLTDTYGITFTSDAVILGRKENGGSVWSIPLNQLESLKNLDSSPFQKYSSIDFPEQNNTQRQFVASAFNNEHVYFLDYRSGSIFETDDLPSVVIDDESLKGFNRMEAVNDKMLIVSTATTSKRKKLKYVYLDSQTSQRLKNLIIDVEYDDGTTTEYIVKDLQLRRLANNNFSDL